MADQLIQLPPVIVRSSNISLAAHAIHDIFKIDCIKKCSFEEQNIAYISFVPMKSSLCMNFYNKLSSPIKLQYKGETFTIESQYFTNI
jgi:hypothetical protein